MEDAELVEEGAESYSDWLVDGDSGSPHLRQYSLVDEYMEDLERENRRRELKPVEELMDGGACDVACLLFGGCAASGQRIVD